MEHLQHFGLGRDPFSNDPLPGVFFESPTHAGAERRLRRAFAQRKGLALLVGPPGSGKTLVVRRLLEQLEEEVYEVSLLVPLKGVADSTWILTRFAQQLGVEEPPKERAALLAQIYEKLAIVREDGRHAVLMVDEAHIVADAELLQELRGLLNLEYEERRLLSLLLVGLPELERAVSRDASLVDRMDVKVRLGPLDPGQAADYLAYRLSAAGGDASLFGVDAVRSLIHHAAGSPRRLNTLADNALFEAYLAGHRPVGAADVETAARDLAPPVAHEDVVRSIRSASADAAQAAESEHGAGQAPIPQAREPEPRPRATAPASIPRPEPEPEQQPPSTQPMAPVSSAQRSPQPAIPSIPVTPPPSVAPQAVPTPVSEAAPVAPPPPAATPATGVPPAAHPSVPATPAPPAASAPSPQPAPAAQPQPVQPPPVAAAPAAPAPSTPSQPQAPPVQVAPAPPSRAAETAVPTAPPVHAAPTAPVAPSQPVHAAPSAPVAPDRPVTPPMQAAPSAPPAAPEPVAAPPVHSAPTAPLASPVHSAPTAPVAPPPVAAAPAAPAGPEFVLPHDAPHASPAQPAAHPAPPMAAPPPTAAPSPPPPAMDEGWGPELQGFAPAPAPQAPPKPDDDDADDFLPRDDEIDDLFVELVDD